MWLIANNRCWSAGRLAERGLPHHECCILCDQEEETIDHLMLACVFAQIWFSLLRLVGLQSLVHNLTKHPLSGGQMLCRVSGQVKKGLNMIVILGAWSIWIHHNHYVFHGIIPSLTMVLTSAREELHLWSVAGHGVSYLVALAPTYGQS